MLAQIKVDLVKDNHHVVICIHPNTQETVIWISVERMWDNFEAIFH